jgi:hypothetical protein
LALAMFAAMALAAASFASAGESNAAPRLKFGWRPLRPSQQRTEDLDERQARIARASLAGGSIHGAMIAKPQRPLPVDRNVRPVVLQTPRPSIAPDDATTRQPPTTRDRDTEPDRFPDPFAPRPDETTPDSAITPPGPQDSVAPDPKQDCATALNRLKTDRINMTTSRAILDLKPKEGGEVPYECTLGGERFNLETGRQWPETCYTWKASGLCHKPLYFEQSHMERYGHSWGPVLDPVLSGAHFFASVPLLPYHMGLEPPCECIYPLGH